MIFEDIMNEVLRRLRVPVITSVTENNYATLIGDLINQTKREVEDAWDWLALENEHSFNTVASTATYTLTNFNERARVRYVHNTTNKGRILHRDKHFIDRQKDFTDNQESQPSWWFVTPQPGADQQIEFHPTPDAVYAIKVYGVVPQDDLVNDTDQLTVPSYPVILGTYVAALAERGDDSGMAERRAQADYQSALSDAIAIDNQNRHGGMASDWRIE